MVRRGQSSRLLDIFKGEVVPAKYSAWKE